MHVLIVEDERAMAELLKRGLEEENHRVTLAGEGRAAIECARHGEFDLIVLDIMLPGMDGFELVSHLRRRQATPILMLTARDAPADIVRGLDLGADDYLTKPFSFDILLARMRALARRGSESRAAACLQLMDLRLDPAAHRVTRGGQEVRLTATEYRLLEFLMRRAGRVVTRHALIEGVWGMETEVEANTLDAFIRLLRAKVDREAATPLIQTERGVGYVMRLP